MWQLIQHQLYLESIDGKFNWNFDRKFKYKTGTLMGSVMGTWIGSSTGRWNRGNMKMGDEAQEWQGERGGGNRNGEKGCNKES